MNGFSAVVKEEEEENCGGGGYLLCAASKQAATTEMRSIVGVMSCMYVGSLASDTHFEKYSAADNAVFQGVGGCGLGGK